MPAIKVKEKPEIESTPAIVEPKETGLALIDPAKVPAYFAKGGCDPLITTLQAELDRFMPTMDISTPAGQKAVRSFLYKLKRSKTAIDDAGKAFVAVPKAVAKVGDLERARVRDAIEAMEKTAGAALAEWEAENEKRIDGHKKAIVAIEALTQSGPVDTIVNLNERLDSLGGYANRSFGEFSLKAKTAIESTRKILQDRIVAIEKATAEREAQEAIDLAEQIKARLARDNEIKRQAAEKATRDAEIAAKQKADLVAAQAKRDAERAAQALKEAEERTALVERLRVAGELKAKQDAIDAENARDAAVAKVERDAEVAWERAAKAIEDARVEAEYAKTAAVQEALKAAEAEQDRLLGIESARRADQQHRFAIDTKILDALYELVREIPIDAAVTAEGVAEFIFQAIRDERVPFVQIAY